MVDEYVLLRNSRHLLLDEFNEDSIKFLLESRILIVGAGGLGCPAALYLATAGVKNIRWVDPDKVEISNLPRQILFSENDLNVPKVIVGKRILNKIVPAVDVDAIEEKADETNLNKLMSGCNIVLDCTDRFKTRHLINKYCVKNKIPLVIGSAVGWSGQLMVVNSSRTKHSLLRLCIRREPRIHRRSMRCIWYFQSASGNCRSAASRRGYQNIIKNQSNNRKATFAQRTFIKL